MNDIPGTTANAVTSLRAAINAMCRSCIYDPANGGTCRKQIIECYVVKCPLRPVRPGATKKVRVPSEKQLAAMQLNANRLRAMHAQKTTQ